MRKIIVSVFYSALFSVAFLVSCSAKNPSDTKKITVGTFNVEWLGDGIKDLKPRSDADYKHMADVIKELDADIIGLEEVENPAAVEKVLKFMPSGYKYFVGKGGRDQNVAVIFRENVNVKLIGEYSPLAIEAERNRPGLVLECKSGNFDWIMMVVHLKSTSRYDSTDELRKKSFEIRRQQSEKLVAWADSIQRGKEKDVMILGDFNDFPERDKNPTLTPILVDSSLVFLTAGLASCKNPMWKTIDHIVVSKSIKPRFQAGSIRMQNFHKQFSDAEADAISDHCPVTVQFEITSPDGD